jgi:Protein of unknown function (DUF5132)
MAKEDKNQNIGESSHHSNEQTGHPHDQAKSTASGRRGTTADNSGSMMASAALIGVGALFEPELLGGMLLGAGAVYVARNLPMISGIFRPILKTVVQAGYAAVMKANEVVAEASENLQDMMAEVQSDYQNTQAVGR